MTAKQLNDEIFNLENLKDKYYEKKFNDEISGRTFQGADA